MLRPSGPVCAAAIIACIVASPAAGQGPRPDDVTVATVDLYGLRAVPDSAARRALGIVAGAPVPDSAARAAAVARVESLPGVRRARLTMVCCTPSGGAMVYLGVSEAGAPGVRFAPAPTGAARLPGEVVAAGAALDRAMSDAAAHGDFAETDSAGHSLLHWPAARSIQLGFVDLATRHAAELRDVLHTASDPAQRALAAGVLAYAPDKAAVVADLADAVHDPDEGVRNDATRALALIAQLAQRRPELHIRIPYGALIELLDSPVWSDRKKASAALAPLTASRDPALMATLRERSLAALSEMARWQSAAHASFALTMLGRLAGMSEAEIAGAIQRGDRSAILAAAEATPARRPPAAPRSPQRLPRR